MTHETGLFEVSVRPSDQYKNFVNRKALGAEYSDDGNVVVWYPGRLEHEAVWRPNRVIFLSPEKSGSKGEETRITYYQNEAMIISKPSPYNG